MRPWARRLLEWAESTYWEARMGERYEELLLDVGEPAPDFTLQGSDEQAVTLSAYRGRMNVCLFFYPKDSTPGCTRQLCAARDDRAEFVEADTGRFGVNPGSLSSHQKFAQKNELDFPLLVDADGQVARLYGAAGEDGKILRTVYLIDKAGNVAFRARGYPTTEEILGALER